MNKDNVKPADKLLRLSSKVLLDFETSWALQSGTNQGAYFEYMRESGSCFLPPNLKIPTNSH
jgi:hypothetical protein